MLEPKVLILGSGLLNVDNQIKKDLTLACIKANFSEQKPKKCEFRVPWKIQFIPFSFEAFTSYDSLAHGACIQC